MQVRGITHSPSLALWASMAGIRAGQKELPHTSITRPVTAASCRRHVGKDVARAAICSVASEGWSAIPCSFSCRPAGEWNTASTRAGVSSEDGPRETPARPEPGPCQSLPSDPNHARAACDLGAGWSGARGRRINGRAHLGRGDARATRRQRELHRDERKVDCRVRRTNHRRCGRRVRHGEV